MTLKKVNRIKEEKNTLHARARNLILASQNTTGCCGGSSDNCCEEDDFFNESQTLIDESEPVSVITNKTIELSESALERIADQVSDIVFKKLRSLSALKDVIKVKINHIGDIVHIGEYENEYKSKVQPFKIKKPS